MVLTYSLNPIVHVIHKITVDFGNPVDVDCGVQPSDATLFHQNDLPGHRVYLLYFLGCGHIFSTKLHRIRLKVGDGHSRFRAILYHIGNQGELLVQKLYGCRNYMVLSSCMV